ncbi:MAG: SIMPL domain-containing protein, partial [Neisseriaceae bacterium]|nr:SIMPL domain-containing protein [Neisseriaceae bacterium]
QLIVKFSRFVLCLASCSVLAAPSAQEPPQVSLSAQSAVTLDNNRSKVDLRVTRQGKNAAELAKEINVTIKKAVELAKATPSTQVQTGRVDSEWREEGRFWVLNSGLTITSTDAVTLSTLLGQLQEQGLTVNEIIHFPSVQAHKAAQDEAIERALTNFKEKAALIAHNLGKNWRIHTLNVNASELNEGDNAPRFYGRVSMAKSMASEDMPVVQGSGKVTAQVSGSVILY